MQRPGLRQRIPAAIFDGGIYAAAIALSRVATLALLPLLTGRLTRDEFGVYGIAMSVQLLAIYVSGVGLDSATTRWFYEYRSPDEQRRTLTTWLWAQLLLSVVVGALGALASGAAANAWFDDIPGAGRALAVSFLPVPLLVVPTVVQHWYRVQQRSVAAFVYSVAVAVLSVAFAVVALGPLDGGLVGVFVAQGAAGAAASVAGLGAIRAGLDPRRVDRRRLTDMLRYSLPVLPSTGSIFLLGLLIRLMIGSLAGTAAAGEYHVVAMISTGAALFAQALQQAWEPYALAVTDREANRPTYRLALVGYAGLSAFVVAGIAAVAPLALRIADPKTLPRPALALVLMSAAVLLGGAMPIVNTGAAIVGNGRPALTAMIVQVVGTLALGRILIPDHGVNGAALAAVGAAVVAVPLHLFLAERVWPVRYPLARVVAVCAAGTAIVTAVHRLTSDSNPARIASAFGVLALAFSASAVVGLKARGR